MNKIIEEIKRVVEEKKYNLDDFNGVIDIVTEYQEKEKEEKTFNEQTLKEKIEMSKKIQELEEQTVALKENYEQAKKDLVDLKLKYIERFDNDENKKENEQNDIDLKIDDLFKED